MHIQPGARSRRRPRSARKALHMTLESGRRSTLRPDRSPANAPTALRSPPARRPLAAPLAFRKLFRLTIGFSRTGCQLWAQHECCAHNRATTLDGLSALFARVALWLNSGLRPETPSCKDRSSQDLHFNLSSSRSDIAMNPENPLSRDHFRPSVISRYAACDISTQSIF